MLESELDGALCLLLLPEPYPRVPQTRREMCERLTHPALGTPGENVPEILLLGRYADHRAFVRPPGDDFLFDYGFAFRREEVSGIVREEFDMGQLLREAPQWLRDYREEVGAPDLESAVSVSAGWSVFAMRDAAVYNTYRVYPHSRLITPLFSGLLELLPNKEWVDGQRALNQTATGRPSQIPRARTQIRPNAATISRRWDHRSSTKAATTSTLAPPPWRY